MAAVVKRSPTQNFEEIIRILRFCASICGIDLLEDNYRMNWITYTLFTSIAGYFGFVAYTIWINYQDDWTIILRSSVTIGTALQGVSKLYAFISNKDVIFDLHKMLHELHVVYEQRGHRYVAALDESLKKVRKAMWCLLAIYFLSYTGIAAMPFACVLVSGKRYLALDFHVPGFDLSTDMGYYSTIGFQSVLLICFGFGLCCGDLVALVYLLQSFMFSNILAAKVESLNELLEQPYNRSKPSITTDLKDIVKWHQLFSQYTVDCNNLFYYVITVQIFTAFGSTVISIFLIVTGAWPGAYPYCLVATSCLYLYCILGTENETANQNFEQNVYDIHWYYMTVPQQKIVLQVLFKTQHPLIIDVAGVMPLSVSTALQLTKTVYTITMAMIQFLSN